MGDLITHDVTLSNRKGQSASIQGDGLVHMRTTSELQRANSSEGQQQEPQEVTAISHFWELYLHCSSSHSLVESKLTKA